MTAPREEQRELREAVEAAAVVAMASAVCADDEEQTHPVSLPLPGPARPVAPETTSFLISSRHLGFQRLSVIPSNPAWAWGGGQDSGQLVAGPSGMWAEPELVR